MSDSKLWMIPTRIKALADYKNKIKFDDIVYVTVISRAKTEKEATEQVESKLSEMQFHVEELLAPEPYDDETFSHSDPCIAYGIEEAANAVESGLSLVAFGFFVTQEHIYRQSKMWLSCTRSLPMFEGPLATDGSESFFDCLLISSLTKEFAEAQAKEALFKQGQVDIEFILLEEIDSDNTESIMQKIDNSGLRSVIENSIDDALERTKNNKQITVVCAVIMGASDDE